MAVELNSTVHAIEYAEKMSTNADLLSVSVQTMIDLVVGDNVECSTFQDSGGNLNLRTQGTENEFHLYKVD